MPSPLVHHPHTPAQHLQRHPTEYAVTTLPPTRWLLGGQVNFPVTSVTESINRSYFTSSTRPDATFTPSAANHSDANHTSSSAENFLFKIRISITAREQHRGHSRNPITSPRPCNLASILLAAALNRWVFAGCFAATRIMARGRHATPFQRPQS